jgi:hypothetical protein
MDGMRNAYILIRKYKGNTKLRRRRKDNIKIKIVT